MRLNFSPVNLIIGTPGAGKTSFLAMLAKKYSKTCTVYSNTPIKGTILINDKDVGYFNFACFGKPAVLLLDESGIAYNNRDFKNGLMSDPMRLTYWKLVRHYHCTIFVASQGLDVDKKIRDLSESMFIIKKGLIPHTSIIQPVIRKIDVDKLSHQLVDSYIIGGKVLSKRIFRPLYYKYFDSWTAPVLPDYPSDVVVD